MREIFNIKEQAQRIYRRAESWWMTRKLDFYWFYGRIYPEDTTWGRISAQLLDAKPCATAQLRRTGIFHRSWRIVDAQDSKGQPLPFLPDKIYV